MDDVRARWGLGIPVLLAVLAHINTLGHGWVLDDFTAILQADHVLNGPWLPLGEATVTGQSTYFRPFAFFLFSVDFAIWGNDPFGFHLTAVILHALATLVFAAVCRELMGGVVGLIAGAIFAVHPVHVEAVANVWNRTVVQAALFYFLALLVHLKLENRWLKLILINVLAFVAIGSKQSAVTLPAALLAIDALRENGKFTLRGAASVLPAIVCWAVLRYLALRDTGAGFGDFYEGQSLWTAVCTNGVILWRCAILLIIPVTLRADYTMPTVSYIDTLSWESVAGYSIGLGLVVAVIDAARRGTPAALGPALVVVAITPFLHLVPLGLPLAERWLYLPSAGVCLAGGWMIWRVRGAVSDMIVGAIAATVITSFLLLSVGRAAEWESPLSLWKADAEKNNASAFTWGNLGLSYWSAGEQTEALHAMERAVAARPGYAPYQRALKTMREDLAH